MGKKNLKSCTAFNSNQCVASGNLLEVARKVKEIIDQDLEASILIFDDDTSELVEMDFRGTMKDVLERYKTATTGSRSAKESSATDQRSQRRPGRPKLGVVSREITLLPRHWDWEIYRSLSIRKVVLSKITGPIVMYYGYPKNKTVRYYVSQIS